MANSIDNDEHLEATVTSSSAAPALLSRVSLGAIIAGTVIAIGLLILLGTLGTAIGFGSVDPRSQGALEGIGTGAGIWWTVTSLVALAIGGYVAGRLSGIPDKSAATAHGASVWGLLTITMLWLTASAAGTTINTAVGAVSSASQVLGSAAQTATTAVLRPGEISQAEATDEIEEVAAEVRTEVREMNDEQVRAEAEAVADSALDALSAASWYAFFASLLSLGAAVLAAGAGAPSRTFVTAKEKIEL